MILFVDADVDVPFVFAVLASELGVRGPRHVAAPHAAARRRRQCGCGRVDAKGWHVCERRDRGGQPLPGGWRHIAGECKGRQNSCLLLPVRHTCTTRRKCSDSSPPAPAAAPRPRPLSASARPRAAPPATTAERRPPHTPQPTNCSTFRLLRARGPPMPLRVARVHPCS